MPYSRIASGVPVAATLALSLLVLGACAGSEVRRFHRFTDDEYRARAEPAAILPGPPRDLSDEGYVLLGHVEVQQPVRECQDTTCWEYTHERPAREAAREIAAKRGGDVVLLAKDDELKREVSERRGRCKVPMTGPGAPRQAGEGFLPEDCLVYEAIPFVRELRVTEGYVWRHQPGRVSSASRALWRKWFPQEPGDSATIGGGEPASNP